MLVKMYFVMCQKGTMLIKQNTEKTSQEQIINANQYSKSTTVYMEVEYFGDVPGITLHNSFERGVVLFLY